MSFSKTFIDVLKDRNEITDVINRYVPLKRAGSNMNGLCPFHSEKTPSFTVFPSTQNYYCFGCGNGGDVINFIMRVENLDYREAVEFLAKRAGIEVEEDLINGRIIPHVKKERVIEATREAAKFYYSCLSTDEGKAARDYLEKRELTPLTVKRFGIGYAPDSWDALYKHLSAKGFTDEELKESFLVSISPKNGRVYDIFRHRLMFPVFDIAGNPVAFSARRLREEEDRKYVNTSDTPAFKKSKVLFALNFAKNNTENALILCEGAVDAVMLHQAGFSGACATLGTSITDEHARTISKIAKTVYLAYDIDKAGRAATEKAITKLNDVGVSAKIISLGSEAKDPDEFIKKFGSDAFRRRLAASEGQSAYEVGSILSKYSLDIADEKSMAAREVASYLATLPSKTDIDIYSALAASKMGISKNMLVDDVMRIRKSKEKKAESKLNQEIMLEAEGLKDRVNRDKVKFSAAATIEEKILGIMLSRPDLTEIAVKNISSESFVTEFCRKIFDLFYDEFSKGIQVNISKDGVLTPDEVSAVSGMIAGRVSPDNNEKVLLSLISNLNKQKESIEADKKIKENPVEGLSDYLDTIRKRMKKQ